MEPLTDELLLRRIASGDETAFAMFYDRFGRLAYSLARRILRDGPTAEDVVQEVFLQVWRRSHTFDASRGSPQAWLLSAVHHRAIDAIRLRRRQPTLNLSQDVGDPHERTNIWNEVSTTLDREALEHAMAQLPREQREVIELAYFGGYTHLEIATEVSSPVGTVKGRMRLGMKKLRNILQEQASGLHAKS